ncbi:Atp synthase mitochondrial f1 complex assembly factor 2, partial [Globisporangium splendens]
MCQKRVMKACLLSQLVDRSMLRTTGRHLQGALRREFSAKAGSGGVAGAKITGVARFYKDVGVKEVEQDGQQLYAVTLDGKTVKTGARTPVRLPSKSLALAVAHEWDAQEKDIRPSTMPIMSLASTALDLGKTSSKKELVDEMMHYFHTDTVCYQVTADQQDKLAALQQKKWNPIRQWFAETFAGDVDVSHGTINGLTHSEEVVKNVRAHLEQSLITAVALLKRHITAKDAMDLSRLEEEFQIGRWGLVEGGHDLDRVNCAVNLSSASFMLWLFQNGH